MKQSDKQSDPESPEREKGAAPPDYMPAIFGWISFEEQQEQARELVDFVKNLKKKRLR